MIRLLVIGFVVLVSATVFGQEQATELGKVKWLRNWDEAVLQSETAGKSIFLLFQEVPGCHTCTTYGNNILSHPLIVEIIEDRFVPLVIFNNKEGYDRKILNRFKEPSWNNPVVRIVNSQGKDIVTREDGVYTLYDNLNRMINALQANNEIVPEYIYNLLEEFSFEEKDINTTYLSMYCFWTGEKEIAKIDGVVGTEAGFMHGKEVVKVDYDSNEVDVRDLAAAAKKKQCADAVFDDHFRSAKIKVKKEGEYRPDRESKYYLYKSSYRYVPMTKYQSMKVNSLLGELSNPDHLLSPRQLIVYNNTKNKKGENRPDYGNIYNSWNWE